MARHSWKSNLRISLINIPVKAYTAAEPAHGKIQFYQLHADCHSRIKYVKTCPVHGEVTKGEIVSGYEYAKGQYVVVDPDEIDKLRSQSEKAISIEAVIGPDQLDPVYFTNKHYYLVPDGKSAEKPFAVMQHALAVANQYAIAHAVIQKRDYVVLLRPIDDLFVMTALNYEAQVKESSEFRDEVPKVHFSAKELDLAKTLLENSVPDEFAFSALRDTHTDKLKQLIEAKIEGNDVVVDTEDAAPPVINLMDALRKSVAKVGHSAKRQPPRRRHAVKRRRKTG